MMKSREEGVKGRKVGEGRGGEGEREACGSSKFSISRTSWDKLVDL